MAGIIGAQAVRLEGVIETVDMHTGGEPVRIVASGYPEIEGRTILDKRRTAATHYDHLRRLLMFEPRGHQDMYGVIPVAPALPGADMAVLFMHNQGYSTMCGHATIALGRYAVDHGIVPATEPVTRFTLEVPCGLVGVEVDVEILDGKPQTGAVRFESVPSFAFATDQSLDVPEIGNVRFDIGYGGAFYALVAAGDIGVDLVAAPLEQLVGLADRITKAVAASVRLEHPDDADLAFLYGTILTDGLDDFSDVATRNICIFAEREVDRSPTGSGVSARIAVQVAKGQIALGQVRRFESVTGDVFTGRGVASAPFGQFSAVRVAVGGRAHYTGTAKFTLEDGDRLGSGFLLK